MSCQLKGSVFRRPAADDLSSQLRPYAANNIVLIIPVFVKQAPLTTHGKRASIATTLSPKMTPVQTLCLCFLR